jgi:hypothetical protein
LFVHSHTVSATVKFKPIWFQNRLCSFVKKIRKGRKGGRRGGSRRERREVEGPPCLRVIRKEDEGRQLSWVGKERPSVVLQPGIHFVSRDCFGLSNASEVGVAAVA